MRSLSMFCLIVVCSFFIGCKFFELMEAPVVQPYPLTVFDVNDPSVLMQETYDANGSIELRSLNFCFAQQNNSYPRLSLKTYEFDQDAQLIQIVSAFASLDVPEASQSGVAISEQDKCPDANDFWNTSRQKRSRYAAKIVESFTVDKEKNVAHKYAVDVFYWYNLCWNEMTETSDLVPGLNQPTGTIRFTQNFYMLVFVSEQDKIVYRNGFSGKDQQLHEQSLLPDFDIPPAFIRELVSKTMEEFNNRRR